MKKEKIDKICKKLLYTEIEYKETWDSTLYKIGDKMYALYGKDNAENIILNLKITPEFSGFFKEKYEYITPGYHMNKVHWISIYLEKDIPDKVILELINHSYELVKSSISKKKIEQIKTTI